MYEFKTKPFAHQREALRRALKKPVYAFLMEMGTGKTKVAIDEIGIYWSEGLIDTAVIVAPKGVYMNWINTEIPTHLGVDADIVHWISGGGNKQHLHQLKNLLKPTKKLRILVMNIEALSRAGDAANYLKAFLDTGRAYVAIDESTKIKNHSSNRTKRMLELGKKSVFRRIMTGSPVTKSPMDLYSQFEFLRGGLLGSRSFYAFRARYAVLKEQSFGGRKFQVIVGFRNIEDLKARVDEHAYRVTKDECLDLPEKIYTRRDVDLTLEQVRIYNEMRTLAFAQLGDGKFASSAAAITQIMRLHQIVCGHITDADGDVQPIPNNRVDALMDVLEETDGDVIIWARYRLDIQNIVAAISETYGTDSVAQFHGGNTKTRESEAYLFKTDPKVRFMVSNQQSGGYGNTWTNATTVIYYSNDYDLEKRVQSEDRAHRAGQTRSVLYVDLVSPGTVDEKILSALRRKINIASQITGDSIKDWIV